jgi:hypothetical protein
MVHVKALGATSYDFFLNIQIHFNYAFILSNCFRVVDQLSQNSQDIPCAIGQPHDLQGVICGANDSANLTLSRSYSTGVGDFILF